MKNFDTLNAGSIFCSVWGYDSTNVDFYQVTNIDRQTFYLRPLSKKLVQQTSKNSGMVVPTPDNFASDDVIKTRLRRKNNTPYLQFDINSRTVWADVWDGREQYVFWHNNEENKN